MTVDAQQVIARSMTEKQLSDSVIELAHWLQWHVHRDPSWRSTGTDPGYPDLTLVSCYGRVIWAELKREKGRMTEAQVDWRARLLAKGHEHYVWTPTSWLSGEVERVLRGEDA